MNFVAMLEDFDDERLQNIFGSNPHDVMIGEIARWWLEDSNKEKHARGIINPAFQVEYNNKKYASDLLLMSFKSSGAWEIEGVIEVENSQKNYLKKLDSLKAYDKDKLPNLQFAMLVTKSDSFDGKYKKSDLEIHENLNNKLYEYSINSNLYWVHLDLKRLKVNREYDLINYPKFKGYNAFGYDYGFVGSPDYIIFHAGEMIKQKIIDIKIEDGKLKKTIREESR